MSAINDPFSAVMGDTRGTTTVLTPGENLPTALVIFLTIETALTLLNRKPRVIKRLDTPFDADNEFAYFMNAWRPGESNLNVPRLEVRKYQGASMTYYKYFHGPNEIERQLHQAAALMDEIWRLK